MWPIVKRQSAYCNHSNKWPFRSTITCVDTVEQRRLDPRKQRTMDALLSAAQRMFAERPVEDVTV